MHIVRNLAVIAALVSGGLGNAGAVGYDIVFDTPEPYLPTLSSDRMGNVGAIKYGNVSVISESDQAKVSKLKSDSWEKRSLPIGNGSIGANIFGSIGTECITFNEKTLWRGGPNVSDDPSYYWNVDKQSAHWLPEIRRAFVDGDSLRADSLVRRHFNSGVSYVADKETPYRFGNFTWMGEFLINTGIDEKDVSGYTRSLSLDSAVVTVAFEAKGVKYKREYFVSYPDNVMVARFSADAPQHLSLIYDPNKVSSGSFSEIGSDGLLYDGRLDDNRMQYAVRITAVADGTSVSNTDDVLTVDGARDVTFLIAADTDYKINFDPDFNDPATYVGVDPVATTGEWMASALKIGYSGLLHRHVRDYKELFDRVSLSLGGSDRERISTPERLRRYREGSGDRYLEELYYQYGRYLLIASSRPGNLPANLQGIWHNAIDGPWHIDYHNNINIQMNYWPACMTGLPECMLPMIDFIRTLEKPGKNTAGSYFGADGWTASISGNIFGFTAPLDSEDMSWNFNPMAGPWLATHLWDYYDYTRDTTYLKDVAYDLIKGSADFVCDYLWLAPDGKYTACPSTSPEHGPVDKGATFVHAVCRELLLDAIEATDVLGVDAADRERWKSVLDNIAPYRIGRYGQLMEWSEDIDDPDDEHRHVNHLFGLHPGRTITELDTPELVDACRVVLEHRGDGATGWSMGWKLNQWARLQDGDHAYTLYGNLLKNGTLDNLWDSHPPFQIDGNFGGTAGVTEMLMQSHTGTIQLLPALPLAWPSGSVKGLVAKGNFVVDMDWADGVLAEASVTSRSGGVCRIRYGKSVLDFDTTAGTTYHIGYNAVQGLILIK